MKNWKMLGSNIDKLGTYLENNDCLEQSDFEGCYRETRLLLIATTKELDASNDRINNLNKVVDKMTGNVVLIIDNLNKVEEPATSLTSVKKLIK